MGEKRKLKVKITPKNSTQKSLQWYSSNKKVVKISNKGVIKAIKKGKATVNVKIKGTNKIAKCKINVIIDKEVNLPDSNQLKEENETTTIMNEKSI